MWEHVCVCVSWPSVQCVCVWHCMHVVCTPVLAALCGWHEMLQSASSPKRQNKQTGSFAVGSCLTAAGFGSVQFSWWTDNDSHRAGNAVLYILPLLSPRIDRPAFHAPHTARTSAQDTALTPLSTKMGTDYTICGGDCRIFSTGREATGCFTPLLDRRLQRQTQTEARAARGQCSSVLFSQTSIYRNVCFQHDLMWLLLLISE